MEVNGLGRFTAYANYAIKVHFDDRTIVRMQKGQEVVKVLSARGEEFVFNMRSIANNQIAQRQFQNYIQVSMEFFDWVFLTAEEQENREIAAAMQKEQIQSEMEKIQRSLNYIQADEMGNPASAAASAEANGEEDEPENSNQLVEEEKLLEQSSNDVYTQLKENTMQDKAQSVISQNQAQIDEIAKLLASV